MAKPVKMGMAELPIRALGGYIAAPMLVAIGGLQPVGSAPRLPLMMLAIIVLLGGAVVHILHKIDQNTSDVHHKIDDSVGNVWDAGRKSGRRQQQLDDAGAATLAVVRDIART